MNWMTRHALERNATASIAEPDTYVQDGRRYDMFDHDLGSATLRERLTEHWLRWMQRKHRRHLASLITRP